MWRKSEPEARGGVIITLDTILYRAPLTFHYRLSSLVQLWLAVTPEFSFLLPMFTFNTSWENRRVVLMNKGERGDRQQNRINQGSGVSTSAGETWQDHFMTLALTSPLLFAQIFLGHPIIKVWSR